MDEDPCLRKRTLPRPVIAPMKRQQEQAEESIPKKKKTQLEEDLEVSDVETSTSVQNLLDIIVEEAVTIEEEKPSDKKKSKFTSNEFVLSSSSEDEDEVKSINERAKEKTNEISKKDKPVEERRKIIVISPQPTKNLCKYIYVKKPKKGERCQIFTRGEFCTIHTKKEKKENPTSRVSNENVRHLQIATQELHSKIDHLLSKEKDEKTTFDSLKKKIEELENKIDSFDKLKKSQPKKIKKMHKLIKNVVYKFLGFDQDNNLKLQSETNNEIILVKRPKSLAVPKNIINCKFKYNFEKQRFEFTAL